MNLATSDVKILAHEIVEDRDPELYVKRAKEFTEKKMYREAEKEYDKAIEYSGKKHSFYLEKQAFYEEIGEKRKAHQLLIRLLITKYLFLVFFLFAWMFHESDIGAGFAQLGCIALGIKLAEIIVKKYKINWRKYVIRALVLAGGLILCFLFGIAGEVIVMALVWIGVAKWVYGKLRDMHSVWARMLTGGLFLYITSALVSACVEEDAVMIVLSSWIYIIESLYEMLGDMRRYSLSQKPEIVEFTFESDFKEAEAQETSMERDAFEDMQEPEEECRPEEEERQPDGMLLALDVPIQSGKSSLDQVIVRKDVVTLPVNGKNIQIDISGKKVETVQDIDFGHCKRYDIKKGSLVYALVAMVEYCMNIWRKEWNDRMESACGNLTVQLNRKLNPYGIRTRLSKNGWQFLEKDVLITFEDVIYLLGSKRD